MPVKFIEKVSVSGLKTGIDTYEVYSADSYAEAMSFLRTEKVDPEQYSIMVETPGLVIGMNQHGLYNPTRA